MTETILTLAQRGKLQASDPKSEQTFREIEEIAGEAAEDSARLDWLLQQLQSGWMLTAIHNPCTGFFIQGDRMNGVLNGEERWEGKRFAIAGKDGSFRAAIDKAREAE